MPKKLGVVDTLYEDCIVPYPSAGSGSGGSFSGDGSNVPGAPPTAGGQLNEIQFDSIKGKGGMANLGKVPGSTKID